MYVKKKKPPKPSMPPPPPTDRGRQFKPIYLVEIYKGLVIGATTDDIAGQIGIPRKKYYRWRDKYPEIRRVEAMARRERTSLQPFPAFIYKKLSPDLQQLWDWICEWEKEANGTARIELMLKDYGKQVRQSLFLHALCVNNFSPSMAMAKVNIDKRQLDVWINNDPDFGLLVEEISWHKGNFFEEALTRLCRDGNAAAIMFANRSWNRNRGYGQSVEVKHSHSGEILHGVLDLVELAPYLSESSKADIMEAMRKLRDSKQSKEKPRPIDLLTQQIADAAGAPEIIDSVPIEK